MNNVTKIIVAVVVFLFSLLVLASYTIYQEVIKRRAEYEQRRVQNEKKTIEEIKITLLEGWTNQDIADYLEKKGLLSAKEFMSSQNSYDFSSLTFLQDKPKNTSLEGYLFPDTYIVDKKTITPETVISKQLKNFSNKLFLASSDVPTTQSNPFVYKIVGFDNIHSKGFEGLSLHDVLTLASIVEKETGIDLGKLDSNQSSRIDEERRIVAGIFLNRMAIGQALESDATINYITGKNIARSTESDLALNSPYNTYKNNGLPPGPIANPSFSSIKAVLHPIKTDYYYFLHKQPSGEVVYSKTFEEHREKKFRFLK
jgi:UPF0755 protein